MKVLVTGAAGQLGYEVTKELLNRNIEVIPTDRIFSFSSLPNYISVDLTNSQNVSDLINQIKPDAIIHCAGYTAVDKAETDEENVININTYTTEYLAKATAQVDAKMIFVSTDYVFDGKGEIPFEIYSPKNPLSVYGKSKSQAEDLVMLNNRKNFIIRTSGIFGINGNNFVKTLLKLASSGKKELDIVNDQITSITYAKDLAKFLVDLVNTEKYGIYHATNEGYLSWFDFAKLIFKEAQIEMKLNPVSSELYKKIRPGQATRPINSRLSKKSLINGGFSLLPPYQDALKRYLKELKDNEN